MDVAEFKAGAQKWLAEQKAADALPPDWGAILPGDMTPIGREWQKRIYDAGYAGIDWPVEYGGRGLTPDHTLAWREACANLGGTTWTYWSRVGLPVLTPSLLGGFLLLFANSFSAFATAKILTDNSKIVSLRLGFFLGGDISVGQDAVVIGVQGQDRRARVEQSRMSVRRQALRRA